MLVDLWNKYLNSKWLRTKDCMSRSSQIYVICASHQTSIFQRERSGAHLQGGLWKHDLRNLHCPHTSFFVYTEQKSANRLLRLLLLLVIVIRPHTHAHTHRFGRFVSDIKPDVSEMTTGCVAEWVADVPVTQPADLSWVFRGSGLYYAHDSCRFFLFF